MSEEVDKISCCASCGIAEGGDIKLKDCSACKLVKYCGIECQRRHRKEHKNECKKRAAELRDEILFKQPESSHRGDCPICCLPLPFDNQRSVLYSCCCKYICKGCDHANEEREVEGRLGHKCPFCRHPAPTSREEGKSNFMILCPICCLPLSLDIHKSIMMICCCKIICNGCDIANNIRESEGRLQRKCPFCRHPRTISEEEEEEFLLERVESEIRAETTHPVAMYQMGTRRYTEGDYQSAFQYFTKAVALGDVGAHHQLAVMCRHGHGVQKDEKRFLYHTEQAAIGGHPNARYNLGYEEVKYGRMDRAEKHWIIAANLGHDDSLEAFKLAYRKGLVSKDTFVSALRGYQAAIDATKSPQREEAEQWYARNMGQMG